MGDRMLTVRMVAVELGRRWASPDETAEDARPHEKTILRWIRDGLLPAVRTHDGYRINEGALAAFERQRATQLEEWRDPKTGMTAREKTLFYVYGISPEAYVRLSQHQGGRCALCQKHPNADRPFVVDHDHYTGAARGLLCKGCNVHLGWAERMGLAKIAKYITEPPASTSGVTAIHRTRRTAG